MCRAIALPVGYDVSREYAGGEHLQDMQGKQNNPPIDSHIFIHKRKHSVSAVQAFSVSAYYFEDVHSATSRRKCLENSVIAVFGIDFMA